MPGVVKVLNSANRKPALGRGLGALLPDARPVQQSQSSGLTRLPIDQIHADRANPRRKTFDEAELEELAASLKQQGVLQPMLVRRDGRAAIASSPVSAAGEPRRRLAFERAARHHSRSNSTPRPTSWRWSRTFSAPT
jgi:hypothetical protein